MKKPKLNIDTKPITSGNEGLDKEKQQRDNMANCEHPKMSYYVADGGDNIDPITCDATASPTEAARSARDAELHPIKHPAVEGAGDVAFICDSCMMIICKNCIMETAPNTPDTPTAFTADFPSSQDNNNEGGSGSNTGGSGIVGSASGNNTGDSSIIEDTNNSNTTQADCHHSISHHPSFSYNT